MQSEHKQTQRERERIRFARPSHVLPEHGLMQDTLDGCPDDCNYECGIGIDIVIHTLVLCEKLVNVRYTVSPEAFHAQMLQPGAWTLCPDCALIMADMARGLLESDETDGAVQRSGIFRVKGLRDDP